jgi:hypothetical protein
MNPILVEMLAKTRQDDIRREYESLSKLNETNHEVKPVKPGLLRLAVISALFLFVVLAPLLFLAF